MKPTCRIRRLAAAIFVALVLSAAPRPGRATTNDLPGPDQDQPGSAATSPGGPVDVGNLFGGSLFHRDLLMGDPGGFREEVRKAGVTVTPTYIGEVMGNPTGGIERGSTYDGLVNVALDIDFERLSDGLLKNLTLHTNALWLGGQGLSTRKIGDFSTVSNISGYNTVRLQELWLQQLLWKKYISLRVGVLAADAEFFDSTNSALFLNGTLGAFNLVGSNLPNLAAYPIAAPGARFSIQTVPYCWFQAGVFGGNSGTQQRNDHGTNLDLRSRDGMTIFAEIAYLINQAPGDHGLTGTYKLGTFVHTGSADFPTFASQAKAALGTGTIRDRATDYGVYGVIDQDLFKTDKKAISAFARGGGAPSDVNFVDWYGDGGVDFTGWIPGRPVDLAGVAFAYSGVSGDFSRASQAQGRRAYTSESVLEATYRATLAPWWSIQPDFQYVLNPSGARGSHDAAVLGLRTTVSF